MAERSGQDRNQADKKKKETILDLSKYLDKKIRVKFSGGREASGILKGKPIRIADHFAFGLFKPPFKYQCYFSILKRIRSSLEYRTRLDHRVFERPR